MAETGRPTTPGIPDPDHSGRWLVRPWPVDASFCEVVQHFLTVYVTSLQSERSAARQLAYFEAYQAALATASTHELTYPTDRQWHDELVASVAACVVLYRQRYKADGAETNANVRRSSDGPVCRRAAANWGRAS